jgi:hypothetical protein
VDIFGAGPIDEEMRVVKNVLDALHPGREINVLCFTAMQIR